MPPQPNQVFVKSVPPTISRKELEAVCLFSLFSGCVKDG